MIKEILMEKEKKLDHSFLDLFRELIHKKLGIYISKDKDYLLESKLGRMLERTDFANTSDLYYSLKDGNNDVLEDLIKYVTTNHTFFFRENMHLKILRNDMLIRKKLKPVIWVAAASTGEEVYSIAIELYENNIRDFIIIASDINKHVLMNLKKGIYSKDRMREVSPDLIAKYFEPVEDEYYAHYRVKEELKKNILIKKLNLVENINFESKFDYIFCRNVLIYFDRDTQIRVVNNLLNNLRDSGYLFVGHSESLLNICDNVETVFTSVYNKKL
jgi:chemotaxis protein methyltransferase CheR